MPRKPTVFSLTHLFVIAYDREVLQMTLRSLCLKYGHCTSSVSEALAAYPTLKSFARVRKTRPELVGARPLPSKTRLPPGRPARRCAHEILVTDGSCDYCSYKAARPPIETQGTATARLSSLLSKRAHPRSADAQEAS